jgi:hypothetical protein
MTSPAHDVLTYVKELEQSGFPHDQAIAIAGGMGNYMEKQLERLVSKPYFDAEMTAVKARLDAVDRRLEKLDSVASDSRLHTWMLALITITIVVPQLQEWFAP